MINIYILLFLFSPCICINCPGCTPLDELTFDKIISKFPASLIKFDVAYPYGEDHEEFAKIAKEAADNEDLFVGEVGIKDYSDRDNEGLGKRFNIKKDEYPVAYVFVNNDGVMDSHRFSGKFTAENLKKFIRRHSGIYLTLPGCIEDFDKIVDKLLTANDKSEEQAVLKEAENQWDKTHGPKMSQRADIYVKIIRKIVDTSIKFVDKEIERVKKLLNGKVSADKKETLTEKLNILKSFSSISSSSNKDEL